MKNFILILVMLITGLTVNSLKAQGSWSLQTNPTIEAGESMQFVSATEGWIGLMSNQLLHTSNAGSLWSVVTPNSTDITSSIDAPGSRISFVSPSTGWSIKTLTNTNQDYLGVVLYKTTDGGTAWSRSVLSTTAGDAGIQVQFVDANNGWILIFNMNTFTPIFLKTTDGGTTWTPTNGGGIFYYVNATTGYSFSASPNMMPPYTIYKTIDGGANWTSQYVDNATGELNAIQFTDADNGWVVGNNGKIYKTTDGGANWNQITNSGYNVNFDYHPLSFINSSTGWIGASNYLNGSRFTLSTTDSGVTWTTQTLPFSEAIYSMDFWDANNGWATSDNGPIAKYSVSTGSYSNATLYGPWFLYTDISPINPFNDNLMYLGFNGNGNITSSSGFKGPWMGNYTVSPSGFFNGTLTNGIESFPFEGQLISNTEGIGTIAGLNLRFHKIVNPSALKDKIEGTLSTANCGSRNITLNIGNNGIITSAIGFSGSVTGRVYTDLGVYIGHLTTGEGAPWNELSIMGYYSNNNLIGELKLDSYSCTNQMSNLVRSINLDTNEYTVNKFLTIYPNPNDGTFCFKLKDSNSKVKIEIFNLSGQKVFETSNFEIQSQNEVNFSPQTKGVYLIKINDGERSYSEKIMIQ